MFKRDVIIINSVENNCSTELAT